MKWGVNIKSRILGSLTSLVLAASRRTRRQSRTALSEHADERPGRTVEQQHLARAGAAHVKIDGAEETEGIVFGPDGNLYVASEATDEIFRYDGVTGAFIDIFIEEASGGIGEPTFILFADQVVVPEPGTLALLGLGLAGIGLTRRRRAA